MANSKQKTTPQPTKANRQSEQAQAKAKVIKQTNVTKKTSSQMSDKMKCLLHSVIAWAIIIAGLVFIGCKLVGSESEVLFKSQELSLWLPTDTFYQTLSIYPGSGLSWIGCYLTQFFYHPALGVSLLMIAWALITLMLSFVYKLRGWKTLVATLVPILLLATFTQTGYWIYYQKLPGHMWVPTLGILFSLLAAIIYRLLKSVPKAGSIAPALWMVVFAWFGYIHMGAWSFAGLAIMASLEVPALCVASPKRWWNLAPIVLTAVLIFIVPRIAYQWVFEQTKIDEVYRAGLPCFRYGLADVCIYRRAYYLLALSFLPIVFVASTPQLWEKKKWQRIGAILFGVALAFSINFTLDRWNHDKNFHAECAMSNSVNRLDWEGTLEVMRSTSSDTIPPTRAMVMMKNLALFRLGRIGDEMFLYPEGSRQQNMDEYYKYGDKMYNYPDTVTSKPEGVAKEHSKENHKWVIRLTQVAGKLLYFNYGKLNYCYRWCMEDAVEFGWHVNDLKMMALCAMMKGEDVVAHKYFDLLKKTIYYKEWAEHYEQFIGKPEETKKQPEFTPICYLKDFTSHLDGDNTLIELYLLQTFANGHGADPIYQEMTLISALLVKDIPLFWPRFMEYANLHLNDPNFHMPRYYQEAAYLYGHLENKVDISQMPFDQSVKDTYEKFMAFNARPDIGGLSEEAKAREFKPQFGDTFYYFYFLVRNQKTN